MACLAYRKRREKNEAPNSYIVLSRGFFSWLGSSMPCFSRSHRKVVISQTRFFNKPIEFATSILRKFSSSEGLLHDIVYIDGKRVARSFYSSFSDGSMGYYTMAGDLDAHATRDSNGPSYTVRVSKKSFQGHIGVMENRKLFMNTEFRLNLQNCVTHAQLVVESRWIGTPDYMIVVIDNPENNCSDLMENGLPFKMKIVNENSDMPGPSSHKIEIVGSKHLREFLVIFGTYLLNLY